MTEKIIKTEDCEFIGKGSYAIVYRISPRRVIKIFNPNFSKLYIERLVKDEITGGNREGCLPVLKTIKVLHKGKKTIGMIKRYLPKEVTNEESRKFYRKYNYCDTAPRNCGKDTRGNIFMVDTQTFESVS